MRQYLLLLVVLTVFIGCRKRDMIPPPPLPPPPPVSAVLVKDIMLEHLPSPYYHFEYDASKKVSFVSFASDFTRYNVLYDGARISEMRNNILVNKDRLLYSYDDDGKVGLVRYTDSTGIVYKTVELFYDGPRLIRLDRARRLGTGFVFEKEITMSYYADGNLKDITYYRPPFEGQTETTYTTHFEQYDDKINVDGFGLIHEEFFDHLFLLPGVQLQKNNPGKETRTGDGVNYAVDYTYTYNDKNAPLTRTGDFVYLNGTMTGQHFQLNSTFSYYQ